MSKKDSIHVLLVEDDASHADLARIAFRSRADEFKLTVVRNLKEARIHLAEATPDLLIVDLVLPDGMGTELLPTGSNVSAFPVVVMSCQDDRQIAAKSINAGALDYVVKSVETFSGLPHIADRALKQWQEVLRHRRAGE